MPDNLARRDGTDFHFRIGRKIDFRLRIYVFPNDSGQFRSENPFSLDYGCHNKIQFIFPTTNNFLPDKSMEEELS